MAKRMATGRAQLDRLLGPNNALVTLYTLQRIFATIFTLVRDKWGVAQAPRCTGPQL